MHRSYIYLVCLQACDAAQRNSETCTQDPFDVGDRVEEPWGPAEPRMGALHDPPARYIILLPEQGQRLQHYLKRYQ